MDTRRVTNTQPAAGRLDSLLGRLEGQWQMTGTVMGDSATYRLDVTRVLQGRFIEMHMEDVNQPPEYEARVFIGVDSAGTGYIAHWLDMFGASSSIPHGTGGARGDTLETPVRARIGSFPRHVRLRPGSGCLAFPAGEREPAGRLGVIRGVPGAAPVMASTGNGWWHLPGASRAVRWAL